MTDTWDALTRDVLTCRRCPRLVAWREEVARVKRRAYRDADYWGRPVPGFGDPDARLVIIGLAPGAHGSNRTGRMFTGDSSGDTLYAALHRAGFASRPTATARDDGLTLNDAFITAVGRCAPPGNKPTSQELANCRPFLARELALLTHARLVLALGRIAFDGYLLLLRDHDIAVPALPFVHGAMYPLPAPWPTLVASYHPSRQNTQTGRLTMAMFDAVFADIQSALHRV
ncbi:MAG TPA: uracil-DNA glycosylase [Anaerolineae bacterium]|nr:uracil-DNA glycosylase [Anaerolineae bacterium]HQH39967.1 uracil-DNA glycosylase [Anaerolineae bacterium]